MNHPFNPRGCVQLINVTLRTGGSGVTLTGVIRHAEAPVTLWHLFFAGVSGVI